MTLFIDACARAESRTRELADAVLSRLGGKKETVKLYDCDLPLIDGANVIKRTELCKKGDFGDGIFDYARQFASADTIVIAAPLWDLSFPAILKRYIEAITVNGLTFGYSDDGRPVGMCRAQKLYYVTTSGGPLTDTFGYGYIKALATGMFGIPETACVSAENLDIWGNDADAILQEAKSNITL